MSKIAKKGHSFQELILLNCFICPTNDPKPKDSSSKVTKRSSMASHLGSWNKPVFDIPS